MQPKRSPTTFSTLPTLITNVWGSLVNPPASLTDLDQKRQVQLFSSISLIIFIVNLLGFISNLNLNAVLDPANMVRGIFSLFLLISYLLSRTRHFYYGILILTFGLSATCYALILANPNLHIADITIAIYATLPLAMVIGSVLLFPTSMILLIAANTILLFAVLPRVAPIYTQPAGDAANILSLGTFLLLTIAYRNASEKQNFDQIQNSNINLQSANTELHEIRENLELRVKDRTAELETITTKMTKRAGDLQAIALVARAITSVQNLEELLPRIAEMISAQFNFYHIGIFLLNEKKDYAVLRASNSTGGFKMLAREHKLRVGETGIVGNVAASGLPRIALNTVDDPIFFNNPDLPTTLSEMALPLKFSGKIIGVLDVQSEQPAAFSEEDINLITILADQVSIAIHNARSFADAQKALVEAEHIANQYLRSAWQTRLSANENAGVRYSSTGLNTFEKPIASDDISLAIKSGENVRIDGEKGKKLTIPIKLRGQVMGVINVQLQSNREWNPAELEITQAIADRTALAIENARLLESSQSQAARERTLSEISAKIGASVNMRNVLQTAVEELGRILPGSDVIIQMESKK